MGGQAGGCVHLPLLPLLVPTSLQALWESGPTCNSGHLDLPSPGSFFALPLRIPSPVCPVATWSCTPLIPTAVAWTQCGESCRTRMRPPGRCPVGYGACILVNGFQQLLSPLFLGPWETQSLGICPTHT
jgi:hypothetical protein